MLAAAWIGAVATVVLAVGAIITAIFAIKAFGKQSQEVALLQQQSARDLEQRRRAQASRIFIWQVVSSDQRDIEGYAIGAAEDIVIDDSGAYQTAGTEQKLVSVHVNNTSDEPVYDMATRWRSGSAEWQEPVVEPVLMPGKAVGYTRLARVPADRTFDPGLFDAFVTFRDASGVRWLRRSDGDLQEQEMRGGRNA